MNLIEEVQTDDSVLLLQLYDNKKLPYEGFTREILVEHQLEEDHFPEPYEVLDSESQAYILTASDSEPLSTHFEGKVVFPSFFRLASFPVIKKEDLKFCHYTEEDIQDLAKEAVLKQEDGKLLTLLADAIENGNPECVHDTHSQFTKDSFSKIVGRIKNNGFEIKNIIVNSEDVGELDWLDTEKYNLIVSPTVPVGRMYLTPVKEKVGVIPNLYGLDIEENHQVERFLRGWVVDEVISMIVLNSKGLGLIKKI